jgi:hypothetical protein
MGQVSGPLAGRALSGRAWLPPVGQDPFPEALMLPLSDTMVRFPSHKGHRWGYRQCFDSEIRFSASPCAATGGCRNVQTGN